MKPFKTKFTKILTGLGVAAALLFSIPSPAVSQETALPGKGEVVLEKAGEIELGDLIQQWASEMDHVYAETRIQAKDTNKKIFERLGINDKAFVRYVNSIKGKENPFARLQKGRLIQQWASEMDHVYAETRIQAKDTNKKIFERLGINDKAFVRYVNSIKGKENPFARLQKGRLIQARLTPTGEVISLRVFRPIDSLSRDVAYFQVSKESGKFKHANLKSEIDAFPIASSAVIKTTLESAAVSANIPANVLAQIKERLSTSMDVNKGVAAGDSFSVIYERRQIDGADLGSGKLLAIEYFSKGKTIDSYWYEGEGVEGYFDSEGNNTDITFLRMPCEARVTSTFNRVRKHPVTGRLRPHWGVDLGAPRGTPVYAAGDGVISSKKYQRRGYGYWLELTHAGGYKSLYAHLSKYAPGMAEGVKVKKGQLIGYVGTSGMVTGPHLHYELKKDGQQINPLIADLRTGENLKDDALEDYKLAISPMRRQIAMLSRLQLAQNSASTGSD
ncbi:peptidoglycan DD-metalloendopeptidase family protein [Parasutterella excrementihominis]|uniref:peptidoglycan DD-metalloendopeptidase family protein n=1 Tax=Parasutterella excrementihominis TaxID=487175 RepID=UPI003FEF8B79